MLVKLNVTLILNKEIDPPEELDYKCKLPLINILWKLNDRCKWSREEIAEWVKQYEK